jgi:hypothetical protein
MMLTVKAEIDENGNVTILEPVSLSGTRRALVVVLDEIVPPNDLPGDDKDLSEAELELEDQTWDDTLKRQADKFAALKMQAQAEVAQGKTIDMFDENGEFTLK